MESFIKVLQDLTSLERGPSQLLALLIALVVVLTFASLVAGLLSFIERRIAGRMQSRIGPNRVGPQGLLQFMADGLKCAQKEDLIPKDADRVLFTLAPTLCFMGVFATFAALPWGNHFIVSDLNIGVLYLISITSLVVIGIVMAGWSSDNKWSLLGGMRSASQMISYEIPLALSLLPAILAAGSLSLKGLMASQGAAPWTWNFLNSPFSFVCFFIFFIAALAEGNRTPFDIPEGESELVAGYCTEYSGFRFLFFFFAEWANLYVIGAISAAVFFGGGNLPAFLGESPVLSLFVFMAKAFVFVFVIIWIRWTLPRFRLDQLMDLCWKVLTPVAFVAFLGQAIYLIVINAYPTLGIMVSYAMTLFFAVVLVMFIKRVVINFKEQNFKRLHTILPGDPS